MLLDSAFTLPVFTGAPRGAVSYLSRPPLGRPIRILRLRLGGVVRDLGQQPQQRTRYDDRPAIAQRGAGLALSVELGGALRAQREVVCRAQMGVHPQLAIDESRDGLGG